MSRYDNLSAPLIIGDKKYGNYTKFMPDGTRRSVGASQCWKDMVMDIFSKRINGTTGKVDYDWNNNAIKFQSGGSITTTVDRVQGNQEINHEFLVGDGILYLPHIHWFQEVVSHTPDVLDTNKYELTMRWRIVRNAYGINLTTPAWNTIVLTAADGQDIFDTTHAGGKEYIGQITRFPDIEVDCDVSDTLQFQIARTDSIVGDMLVYFFDLHGLVDSDGSDDEIYKRP